MGRRFCVLTSYYMFPMLLVHGPSCKPKVLEDYDGFLP